MTDVIDNAAKTVITHHDKDDHFGHRGLEGKDASFLSYQSSSQAYRQILDAIRDESRHTADRSHDNSHRMDKAIADSELRISTAMLKEHSETRAMFRDQENTRLRDEIARLRIVTPKAA